MRTLTSRLLLCLLLVIQAQSAPITYQQVSPQVGRRTQQPPLDNKGDTKGESQDITAQTPPTKISESGAPPEFVRLADGRIVPYGPGVVCSDDCVQAEAFGPIDPMELRQIVTGLHPWLLAAPAIVGGVVACVVLCRGGEDSSVVLAVVDPPRVITPPPPNRTDVPEPATLLLLGLGLAMIARHGFGKKKPADK